MKTILTAITSVVLLCRIALAGEPSSFQKLENTPLFAFGGIGFAGTTSEGELAFHEVLISQSAENDFRRLLKSGNAPAKCYALVGLRLKNRAAFDKHVKLLITSKEEVQTCSGCIKSKMSMSYLVASIQSGTFDQRASATPRPR